MQAQNRRQLRSGKEYDKYFPKPDHKTLPYAGRTLDYNNITVFETLDTIEFISQNYSWQTEKIAQILKGRNLEQTCKNIFNFLYEHIQYQLDEDDIEQVKTPAMLWYSRTGDCDCYTAFISCVLTNLQVPFYLKMTDYGLWDNGEPVGYQHVYIAVPTTNGSDYIIDVVKDAFNDEQQGIAKAYYKELNGAAPRPISEAGQAGLNGLNGGLGEPITMAVTAIASLTISAIGAYNKSVENDRAMNSAEDAKIDKEQEMSRAEVFEKLVKGEIAFMQTQLAQLRQGRSIGKLSGGLGVALQLPTAIENYYLTTNSFTEFYDKVVWTMKYKIHESWGGGYGGHDWMNRYSRVISQDVTWAYAEREKVRKQFAEKLFAEGEISEKEMMQLINFEAEKPLLKPQIGSNVEDRFGGKIYNANFFPRKKTYTDQQVAAAKTVSANQQKINASQASKKGDNSNENGKPDPKTVTEWAKQTWETPQGKVGMVATGVVATGFLIWGVSKIF